MSRRPKPWFRKSHRAWFVTLDGRQHNLGPQKKAADRQFKALLKAPREVAVADPSVAFVFDQFLDWTEKHRAPRTFEFYRQRLQWFLDHLPSGITCQRLKPFHVQEWIDAHPNWSDSHRRGCIVTVQRAFRWAERMEIVQRNPVRYIEKPAYEAREQVISLAEYRQILAHACDEAFRDLIVTHWETGCRPQESVRVEARHVDLPNRRWVFPTKEAKGKRAPRIVYLSDAVLEITRRRMEQHPQGPLFRNSHGAAWHPWAVNNRFGKIQAAIGKEVMKQKGLSIAPADIQALVPRLKPTRMTGKSEVKKTPAELRAEAKHKLLVREARKHGPRYCLYAFRHTFATRMLNSGVDALTVAMLLGHRDVSMLARVYQHLSFQPEHFHKQLRDVESIL